MTPQDQIYSVPTTVGAAKLAYAMANELTVKISHMAIGDGNGQLVEPASNWPALAREVHRAQLNQLYQHPDNPNWLVAELVLPAEVGGWTIREIALYDVDGDLIFIGNHAEQYKPVQSQGSDETKTIRMVILVSDVATVTLKTDPTTVMATIDYVQRELAKLDHKQSVRYTTTAAVVLSGLGVQAGGDWAAALTAGDRVLVKNQAAAKDNGIYVVAVGVWVRSTDADISAEVTPGLVVAVEQGAALADTRWQLVTDGEVVLGITGLVFQNVTQGFAPLASPTFVGDPKAPTPAQFDADQSIATMQAVQRALGNHQTVLGISATTTLTAASAGAFISLFGPGGFSVTLPLGASVPIGSTFTFFAVATPGQVFVQRQGADQITMSGSILVTGLDLYAGDSLEVTWSGTAWVATGSVQSKYQPGFAASLAGNGYQKLPSGFIEQWGEFAAPMNSTTQVALPIPFPNAFHQVFLTVKDTAQTGTSLPFGGAVPVNLSAFSLRNFYTQSGLVYSFRAIGK